MHAIDSCAMSDTLTITAGQLSDRGRNAVNEDCCGLRIPSTPLLLAKGVAAIVADGAGSGGGGREASESCVLGFLNDYYSTPESWAIKTAVPRVLNALNRWLYSRSVPQHDRGLNMVTTLSLLIIQSAAAHLFHIGNSRIYRYRSGELEQLTTDHRRPGPDGRHVLTRALGVEPAVRIDFRGTDVAPGDCFLLTTDGVHDHLTHAELCLLINGASHDLEQGAHAIVERALENGSDDNATCQLIRIEAVPGIPDPVASSG